MKTNKNEITVKRNCFQKCLVGILVLMLAVFDPMATVTNSNGLGTGMAASAATTYTYTYYKKYTGTSGSLVTALKAIGVNSSFSNRKAIANLNGISNYSGSSAQNKTLLKLLKAGKLVKTKTAVSDWEISAASQINVSVGSSSTITIRFKGTGISSFNGSISNSSNVSSVYFSGTSWKSAGNWCSTNLTITGKTAGTCTVTFTLNGTTTKSTTIMVNVTDNTSLISANLSKITFQKQGTSTCKATSLAMALNLIVGRNSYTTKGLGSSSCVNINNKTYSGSNGATYIATYRQDSYVGSKSEVTAKINAAVSAGLPIVVAVHSTSKSRTQHHYVIITGITNGVYQIIDPSYGTTGKLLSASVTTMSARSYELGLADYGSKIHYSYISFAKK